MRGWEFIRIDKKASGVAVKKAAFVYFAVIDMNKIICYILQITIVIHTCHHS